MMHGQKNIKLCRSVSTYSLYNNWVCHDSWFSRRPYNVEDNHSGICGGQSGSETDFFVDTVVSLFT